MADIQQHYAMFVIFVLNLHWVTLVILACVSVPKVSTNLHWPITDAFCLILFGDFMGFGDMQNSLHTVSRPFSVIQGLIQKDKLVILCSITAVNAKLTIF